MVSVLLLLLIDHVTWCFLMPEAVFKDQVTVKWLHWSTTRHQSDQLMHLDTP